ncbi:MAG: glycosyltransferase family 4 protein [Bacteroidales bacterium]|nr:glycosyltransferase family 4 protein [Bacteroidales bacterium]
MSNLYISTYPAPYRIDLCNALAERMDCQIYHYVPAENEERILENAVFENRRLEVGSFHGKSYPKGLADLIEKNRPSTVFSQEFSLITIRLIQLRRRYGYKLAVFCDDSMDMIRGNDFSAFHRVARKIIPGYVDELILHSPDVLEWYRDRFGKGILMPIVGDDVLMRERLAKAAPLTSVYREKYGLDGKKTVLFVGRLVGLKNLPRLFEAFSRLGGGARLIVVGDGPDRAELEALSSSLGINALFTGFLYGEELLAWFNAADVLALPSTQEAFGAVTGEGLTCGCRVLVSSKAGSSSLVREGENGFTVDPYDIPAMSGALARLLDMPALPRDASGLRANLLPVSYADSIKGILEL